MSAAHRNHRAFALAVGILAISTAWALAIQPVHAGTGTTAWQNGRFVLDTPPTWSRSRSSSSITRMVP